MKSGHSVVMKFLRWFAAVGLLVGWAGSLWAQNLDAMTAQLASGELGQIDGVLIRQNGQTVYEERFRGYQGQPLPVYSVTKSVGSILMGTLVRDGLLDVSDPLNDYFPAYPRRLLDSDRQMITVSQLLQQRHGHAWDEWPYGRENHPISTMLTSPDWFSTVITWPMAGPPGNDFIYSTGASTLMSGIILEATGETTQQYAQRTLFDPLGISDFRWAINVLDSRDVAIDESGFPQGIAPLGFSLWLRLEDMGKIGQMMLDDGQWNSQAIVSKAWIDESMELYSDHISDNDIFARAGQGYGYQWWRTTFTDALGRTFDSFYADGYGRQYIFVVPEADLVVVSLAADYHRDGPGMGTAMREHILPALAAGEGDGFTITSQLNGSWFDPATSGQGINLEVLDERGEALVYWYTYDDLGNQQWLVGQGQINDDQMAELDFVQTQGGRFLEPDSPDFIAWGTGVLSFSDCLNGRLAFEKFDNGQTGETPLARLTGAEKCVSPKSDRVSPADVP